jgi:AraC-like DNA-binding protein
MSAATLNRKLKAEQRSFQQIKDDLRYNKAQRLLRDTTLSVDQIADQLGYSDASNFAKAFKGWSGSSPSQFRQQ